MTTTFYNTTTTANLFLIPACFLYKKSFQIHHRHASRAAKILLKTTYTLDTTVITSGLSIQLAFGKYFRMTWKV
jgi:hypothetical protein